MVGGAATDDFDVEAVADDVDADADSELLEYSILTFSLLTGDILFLFFRLLLTKLVL